MRLAVISAIVSTGISSASAAQGPCDIYGSAGTPCVAAHSVVRALYGSYNGNLYQVNRTDGNTQDIGLLAAGGVVNASAQDAFCGNNGCVISRIYDQSPNANHLDIAPAGGAAPHVDRGVNATALKITIGGVAAYGAYFEGGQGYRIDKTVGVATGNDPETLYMVTSATHFNDGCCFDYGNAEANNNDDGAGAMEAVYLGNLVKAGGPGPWVMADLENGLWADNTQSPSNPSETAEFLTAMVKGGTNGFGLKSGDAQQGPLNYLYYGPRPKGYQPMRKQGSIILGIGGDNSDWAVGTFYEGVMTAGFTTDAADDAVHANIVAAGYGK